MDKTPREAEPQFSRPLRQVVLMTSSCVLFATGAYLAYPQVAPVFMASPYLNGAIFCVFLIGVATCFLQVIQLGASVRWIEDFASGIPGHNLTRAPRLLAPLAALLRKRRDKRMQINTGSARTILDSVATRIEEQRDITRYLTNLLIFLGLLGTFYGLATVVPAVVDTIRSLAPRDGEGGVEVFGRLMTGLESQLGGMGTAFASSLLGLAGSLVVGLLELFAGHGQNRFYQELEEWLSSITRLGFSTGETEGEVSAEVGLLAATLDQLAEQMEGLHTLFAESEGERVALESRVGTLAEAVNTLGAAMERQLDDTRAVTEALSRVADAQGRATAAIEARMGEEGALADAEARMRLRSIDVQLLRILEEISAGRQETVTDLRGDLAALGRVLSRLAPGDERWG
ncbi:biopolymer transporter ExbB [Rhodovulum sp. BSW8]|uniref:Biopolymer transporter ExbB n=1 Tax=Rhodovulum visakhapatnamense TaxID=364297 RepID=A0ABS1RHZ5_9RHOB|nr:MULTISPECIES: biopolymer transporter ExbB [Rhodovulum]MBL3570427.1 biopolymer transporter ExbB [Rhodovulum visakhapatnamense]MBL3579139.1 biopolymer transporter ExbB [Rhodovulum visakhapatnamense]OLS46067.1 biopolymer transporter ExbB [Rhodovulum sulfidophilum]RBO54138.1 biopolymer transporter ExbB [Rhodovulum sp. BSW8]